ncbi:MAG TPA: DegT/DnrJ/EryC1/StrS family aminotransferase, partial [Parvularculaceae bacterium]|nr:DegT/DnrJ/EryC1/StrS family aminotransferase [Parvularculaceae bacterium]
AVIPVDIFGSPADYRTIGSIAKREDLFLLADAAQSFGGRLDNRWVGDLAPATATSFFPGKSLGAYGDAGAILAQTEEDAERWRSIRWHGTDSGRKISVCVGMNGRLDSFQAAVLLEKLSIFDDELNARRAVAAVYDERLGRVSRPQQQVAGSQSGYGYYSIRIENRDGVAERLMAAGVPVAIYYETPLHQMPAFARFAPAGGLPHTERLSREVLSLPMHPYLSPDQVDHICGALEAAAACA